jgi:glyoxylase-like metal-dependent hydrolase (beta-lactamase superfamily II)
MKILNLTEYAAVYTSNVFFVRGTWNTLADMNTLVDVGRDPAVLEAIKHAPTGIGQKRVSQVVLTHGHYDHVSMLPAIRELFSPVVYAFSPYLDNVDVTVTDGDPLTLGDRTFEVIHTPGHSQDSICLYCARDKVLFAGDTPLIIRRPGDTYQPEFVQALQNICRRDVQRIYFGHGAPLTTNCNERLRTSLRHVTQRI